MMASTISPMRVTSHVESDVATDLARFIEDQVRRGCFRIVLAQKVAETHHTVNEWLIAEMLDASSLSNAVYSTGVHEAQTLRESVAYGVFAFRADSPGPAGRFVFRIEAGSNFNQRSDTPDDRGLIAMLMNHTELSARLSLGHSREIVDQYQVLLGKGTQHLSSLLEQAYERIRVLEAREVDALELREKLQAASFAQSSQVDSLKRKDEMRKFAMDKLAPVIPIVIAKLMAGGTGARSSPGAATPSGAADVAQAAATAINGNVTEQIVVRLIQSMNGEQLGAVARLLNQEQLSLFAQLYELYEARTQAAPPAANDTRAATESAVTSPPDSPAAGSQSPQA